jgi:hypothetical protein
METAELLKGRNPPQVFLPSGRASSDTTSFAFIHYTMLLV